MILLMLHYLELKENLMRPVDKWAVEHQFLLNGVNETVRPSYSPYSDSKPVLTANLGKYCSYCEKAFSEDRDLQVEHIQPKGYKSNGKLIYKHLEKKWSNFLLSCATCNGADNKDTKNVNYNDFHFPHLNNTYLSLIYDAGGVVKVNDKLPTNSQKKADNLLKLVGLDKTPTTSSNGDKRWNIRSLTWNVAQRYLNKYQNNVVDKDTIIDLAKAYGCWSIWFTVFNGHDDVRKALIDEFPGTAKDCFDPNNHYEPIPSISHPV